MESVSREFCLQNSLKQGCTLLSMIANYAFEMPLGTTPKPELGGTYQLLVFAEVSHFAGNDINRFCHRDDTEALLDTSSQFLTMVPRFHTETQCFECWFYFCFQEKDTLI